jgi:hypothetical protein
VGLRRANSDTMGRGRALRPVPPRRRPLHAAPLAAAAPSRSPPTLHATMLRASAVVAMRARCVTARVWSLERRRSGQPHECALRGREQYHAHPTSQLAGRRHAMRAAAWVLLAGFLVRPPCRAAWVHGDLRRWVGMMWVHRCGVTTLGRSWAWLNQRRHGIGRVDRSHAQPPDTTACIRRVSASRRGVCTRLDIHSP